MSSAIGLVKSVDVGVTAWSKERFRAAAGQPQPLGGLVVAVTEKLDHDTGEVLRAFLTFDHQQTRPFIQWTVMAESEVDRESIEAVDASVIVKAWRRLAEDIAFSAPYKQRKGPATVHEVRACQAMSNLMALVFGPEGVLHAELAPLVATAPAPRPSYPPHPGLVDD